MLFGIERISIGNHTNFMSQHENIFCSGVFRGGRPGDPMPGSDWVPFLVWLDPGIPTMPMVQHLI
jgi:hypothetical protein